MANILGLDLGTNSIGWAVINNSEEQKDIIGSGSRIIPMTQDTMGAFTGGGNIETQTKVRTGFRGARRLAERSKLRRERLLRVLNVMGFLPQHFVDTINFDHTKPNLGKIPDGSESKVAWVRSPDGIYEFIFKEAFEEMLKDFAQAGVVEKIPYDWTLYYLRKKGLKNGVISYRRRKTGQQLHIKWELCMQEILDKRTMVNRDYITHHMQGR